MAIRPANSIHIINRLFSDYELAEPSAMELAGLHDELSRLERKWLIQIAEGSDRRQSGDLERLDAWFDRLRRLLQAAERRGGLADIDAQLLRKTIAAVEARKRQPPS